MNREQIALKFPAGTKTRIKALALPGESMTVIILRALDGLETTPLTPVVARDEAEPGPEAIGLPARVDALEERIAALEVSRSDLDSSERLAPIVKDTRLEDIPSLVREHRPDGWKAVADALNRAGITTPRGKQWTGQGIEGYARRHGILGR